MTEQEMDEKINDAILTEFRVAMGAQYLKAALAARGLIICSAEPVAWKLKDAKPRWPMWERSPMFTDWRYSGTKPRIEEEFVMQPLYAPPTRETT